MKAWVQINMQLLQGQKMTRVAIQADTRAHEHAHCCKGINLWVRLFLPLNGVFTNLAYHAFSHGKHCEGMGAYNHATISRKKDDVFAILPPCRLTPGLTRFFKEMTITLNGLRSSRFQVTKLPFNSWNCTNL